MATSAGQFQGGSLNAQRSLRSRIRRHGAFTTSLHGEVLGEHQVIDDKAPENKRHGPFQPDPFRIF
jgi:hypothetical protein